MVQYIFKDERKIRDIGGRLAIDYYTFKKEIEYINDYFFDLFHTLGLTDNINMILETLNNELHDLCSVYIYKRMRDIEDGKISKNEFLSKRMIKEIEIMSPDEQVKVWERETKRALRYIYKGIFDNYRKEYGLSLLGIKQYNKRHLEICGKTLFVTPSRIEIDGEKFIDIYTDFLAADESNTHKLHEQAAASMNKFFNGVEITHKELSKYFILENGRVNVRPASINRTDYARLGARTYKVESEL